MAAHGSLGTVQAMARAVDDGVPLAMALWGNGMFAASQGRIEVAASLFEEMHALSHEIGFRLGVGAPTFWLGQVAWARGDRALPLARLVEEALADG